MLKSNQKTFYFILLSLFILISLWYTYQWLRFLNTAIVPTGQSFYYILKPGHELSELSTALQKKGYLKNRYYLIFLAKINGDSSKLKAGEYLFKGALTPSQLLNQIVIGRVIQRRFIIIEGWTFRQIIRSLNAAPLLKHELSGMTNEQIAAFMKIPFASLEGLFYPATYRYIMGVSDQAILQNAYDIMQKKLQVLWAQRATNLPYETSYQALIASSMIEKETSLVAEKPLISGVIINRLQKRMPLQIDPTVIYGLGKLYDGKLKIKQLKHDSPYNTYIHRGLPPTPIAAPTETSLIATLHPAETDALYYEATGSGGHHFSATFKEHKQAIKRLRARIILQRQLQANFKRANILPMLQSQYLPCNVFQCCLSTDIPYIKSDICTSLMHINFKTNIRKL